jgi:hypothetical protein
MLINFALFIPVATFSPVHPHLLFLHQLLSSFPRGLLFASVPLYSLRCFDLCTSMLSLASRTRSASGSALRFQKSIHIRGHFCILPPARYMTDLDPARRTERVVQYETEEEGCSRGAGRSEGGTNGPGSSDSSRMWLSQR